MYGELLSLPHKLAAITAVKKYKQINCIIFQAITY